MDANVKKLIEAARRVANNKNWESPTIILTQLRVALEPFEYDIPASECVPGKFYVNKDDGNRLLLCVGHRASQKTSFVNMDANGHAMIHSFSYGEVGSVEPFFELSKNQEW